MVVPVYADALLAICVRSVPAWVCSKRPLSIDRIETSCHAASARSAATVHWCFDLMTGANINVDGGSDFC